MNNAFTGKVNRIKNSIPRTNTNPADITQEYLADIDVPQFKFKLVTLRETQALIQDLSTKRN